MEIVHVAAECYPYAKVGGLGDVVGALPKYQNLLAQIAKVVVPMHRTKFLYNNEWETVGKGNIGLGSWRMDYTVIKEKTNKLGFDLYCVDIFGLTDRENVYSYDDDAVRYLAFQAAVVDWINRWEHLPDLVHVHDYHAGLIPFFMQYCFAYSKLKNIKTVLTIHNAQYQGWMDWEMGNRFPDWDPRAWGKLDWKDMINPLAAAVKCVWKVNTVSQSYMEEIRLNANGLENLFEYERGKCTGIINGIDTAVWNPENDLYINDHFDVRTVTLGKHKNKRVLCEQFNLDITRPLMVFIGRLVGEKAADILPETFKKAIYQFQGNVNFLVLGTGEPEVENQLAVLNEQFSGYYHAKISYNEALSHLMYAGADFILMPSRVEPCGLNQLYALRYGTIPMVRNTGGLKDTVVDIGDHGYGFKFNEATAGDLLHAIGRGIDLFFNDHDQFHEIRETIMQLDYSWERAAQRYLEFYNS
jgi:starch synthase